MASIEEVNDLSILPTDELFGKLVTYEIKMNQVVQEKMAKNDKSIALKARRDTSDSDSSKNEDEYAIILKRVRDLIMKKRWWFKKQDSNKKDTNDLLWMQQIESY